MGGCPGWGWVIFSQGQACVQNRAPGRDRWHLVPQERSVWYEKQRGPRGSSAQRGEEACKGQTPSKESGGGSG